MNCGIMQKLKLQKQFVVRGIICAWSDAYQWSCWSLHGGRRKDRFIVLNCWCMPASCWVPAQALQLAQLQLHTTLLGLERLITWAVDELTWRQVLSDSMTTSGVGKERRGPTSLGRCVALAPSFSFAITWIEASHEASEQARILRSRSLIAYYDWPDAGYAVPLPAYPVGPPLTQTGRSWFIDDDDNSR
jgi:hypothetical protein